MKSDNLNSNCVRRVCLVSKTMLAAGTFLWAYWRVFLGAVWLPNSDHSRQFSRVWQGLCWRWVRAYFPVAFLHQSWVWIENDHVLILLKYDNGPMLSFFLSYYMIFTIPLTSSICPINWGWPYSVVVNFVRSVFREERVATFVAFCQSSLRMLFSSCKNFNKFVLSRPSCSRSVCYPRWAWISWGGSLKCT